jgi:prephenate dehydrogenase
VETIGSKFKWIDSNKHDELIGLTSHLPHIISSSLVSLAMKEQNLNELLDLASGGFDGATRLSRTSPNMISSMYLTNSPNVRQLIEKLINELQLVLNMEDEEVMLDYLSGTVDWRRALAEKFGERELS